MCDAGHDNEYQKGVNFRYARSWSFLAPLSPRFQTINKKGRRNELAHAKVQISERTIASDEAAGQIGTS